MSFRSKPDFDEAQSEALCLAGFQGNTVKVTELLQQKNVDVNFRKDARDGNSFTALYAAALNGHLESVRVLLEAKANVNSTNKTDQGTALHVAVLHGNEKMVSLLLQFGANVNTPMIDGSSALHVCAFHGNVSLMNVLLFNATNKPKVNLQTNRGDTPLHVAVENNHLELVKVLLDVDAVDVDVTRNDGLSALLIAAKKDNMAMVQALMQRHAYLDEDTFHQYHFDSNGDMNKILSAYLDNQQETLIKKSESSSSSKTPKKVMKNILGKLTPPSHS